MAKELHPVDIYAGQQLRALRKLQNISQFDLCNQLPNPISFQQLQKYEKGVNRMCISRAYEFANIFGVSVITFFPDDSHEDLPMISKQESRVLDCLRKLPEHQRASIEGLIKAI